MQRIAITECPGVYPPREDTFLLLEALEVTYGERFLEIGCGTGIVSIHCALAGATVIAVDINEKAARCTVKNARCNNVQIDVINSDMFSSIRGRFDTIIFNPPYLPADDHVDEDLAWNGGKYGTAVLEKFLREAPAFLSKNGRIIIVVSSLMDESELKKILSNFSIEKIGERRLFFETLSVLQLQPMMH